MAHVYPARQVRTRDERPDHPPRRRWSKDRKPWDSRCRTDRCLPCSIVPPSQSQKILETFFLTEEKRLIRTQNFRNKPTFQDLPAYSHLPYRPPHGQSHRPADLSRHPGAWTRMGPRGPRGGERRMEARGRRGLRTGVQMGSPTHSSVGEADIGGSGGSSPQKIQSGAKASVARRAWCEPPWGIEPQTYALRVRRSSV
jgi:hypothetical protein